MKHDSKNYKDCKIRIDKILVFLQMNGMRLELTKPEDIEVLGKLIYSTVDKVDEGVKCVEAYRYLLIIMKSVLGLNTLESDK